MLHCLIANKEDANRQERVATERLSQCAISSPIVQSQAEGGIKPVLLSSREESCLLPCQTELCSMAELCKPQNWTDIDTSPLAGKTARLYVFYKYS